MKPISLIIALSFCSSANAWEFNVGPYKLGMTNAQAAKFGLKDCKKTSSRIECSPVFDSTINLRRGLIAFDPKTKRVIEIRAYIAHFPFSHLPDEQIASALARSRWTDNDWYRMAQDTGALLRKSLSLEPCKSKLIEYDNYTARKTEKCHLLPDVTRTIMYGYNNTYDGGARHRNDPHLSAYVTLTKGNEARGFVRYLKAENEKKRKESAMKSFQAGR